MGQSKSVFAVKVERDLICQECKHVYNTPLVGACGHILCQGCWYVVTYEGYVLCPLCVLPLPASQFYVLPNVILKERVDELPTKCDYLHCREIVPLKQRQQHIHVYHEQDRIAASRKRFNFHPRKALRKIRKDRAALKNRKFIGVALQRICVALCISAITSSVSTANENQPESAMTTEL